MDTHISQSSLPEHIGLTMANSWEEVSCLDLNEVARAKVFSLCALTSAPVAEQWVTLLASWGYNLSAAPIASQGMSSLNWLWNALSRGKLAQARALVRMGFTEIQVDANGKSGLGLLIEATHHDRLVSTLELIEDLAALGMPWQAWPDAVDFQERMIKNVGRSLSELLSDRAHARLMLNTNFVDTVADSVRL